MARFSSEIKLPSCIVTKELIESIEKYLRKKFLEFAASEKGRQGLEQALLISISDSLGTECLNSISDFSPPRFSDHTTSLRIRMRSMFNGFEVDVRFDISRDYSRVAAMYEGCNSREYVTGLLQGILNCVATKETKNWLFHLSIGLESCLFALGFLLLSRLLLVMYIFGAFSIQAYISLFWLLTISAYWGAKRLKPYTMFDSNLADKRAKLWNCLVGGFITVIL